MSDVGKMIHSCSDKQVTAERPFQEHVPFSLSGRSSLRGGCAMPKCKHRKADASQKLFFDGDKHPSKCPKLQTHQT